jgi:hypothetical protein
MKRFVALMMLTWGCTTIDEPAARPPHDAGAPDATTPGGYTGPCEVWERTTSWGVLTMAHVDGDAPGTALDWTVFNPVRGSEILGRMHSYVAGDLEAFRGRVVPLGAGANADFATCTHCFIIERDCDAQGGNCQRGPYFPRSGTAVAHQVADASTDRAATIEFGAAEFHRVQIDETLHVTAAEPSDDCIYVERMFLSARTQYWLVDCDFAYQCEVAATLSQRH